MAGRPSKRAIAATRTGGTIVRDRCLGVEIVATKRQAGPADRGRNGAEGMDMVMNVSALRDIAKLWGKNLVNGG
jgi:hypothetical protein